MLSAEEDILAAAERWRKSGRMVALATVVETWGWAGRRSARIWWLMAKAIFSVRFLAVVSKVRW